MPKLYPSPSLFPKQRASLSPVGTAKPEDQVHRPPLVSYPLHGTEWRPVTPNASPEEILAAEGKRKRAIAIAASQHESQGLRYLTHKFPDGSPVWYCPLCNAERREANAAKREDSAVARQQMRKLGKGPHGLTAQWLREAKKAMARNDLTADPDIVLQDISKNSNGRE